MRKRFLSLITTLVMAISLIGVLPAIMAGADSWGVWSYRVLNDGTAEITDFDDDGVKSLNIPSIINGYTVTSLGSNSFAYNQNLTNVTIPDTVTKIGERAFDECYSITKITIPDSVTYIGYEAFQNCQRLTSINIGNGVTYIPEGVFYDCIRLTSVTLGNNIETIDDGAFGFCESLKSITIPDSVTSIGEGAFYGCTSLTRITIPDSVTSLGSYAFCDCTGLTSIIIPKSITSIEESMFKRCSNKNLKIYLLGEITSIDSYAFEDVTGTVYVSDESIIGALPSTVKSILFNDYGDCGDNVMWLLDSTGNLTILGQGSMNDYLNDDSNTAPWYDYREDITSVVIEKNITNIGDYAFYSFPNLSKLTIPDSVTSIGNGAFYDCESLTSVTIPKSVTSIGYMAFGYTYDTSLEEDVKASNFKINCYKGTAGDKYATDNGFEVAYLDPPPTATTTAKPTTTAPKSTTPTKVVKPAKVTKVTKPAKVKIKKATFNGYTSKFKIKWKKVKGATGYQVKYTAIAFEGKKTWKKSTKKKSYKFKADYFIDNGGLVYKNVIKVRAYKTVNGKKYYGKWSKAEKFYFGI